MIAGKKGSEDSGCHANGSRMLDSHAIGPQMMIKPMSTSRHWRTFCDAEPMSALPPKADMCGATRDVCFGPIADMPLTRIIDLGIVILQNKNPGDQAGGFSSWSLAYQSTLRPTKILSTKISKICCGTSRAVPLHH